MPGLPERSAEQVHGEETVGEQVICPVHNTEMVQWGRKYRRFRCKECARERSAKHYAKDPRGTMLRKARKRAAERGLPFTIKKSDIVIPDVCPVLGIKLRPAHAKTRRSYSPTVDRRHGERGYTPENIAVISWRANDLKKDGTIEEFEQLLRWMKS